MLSVSSIVQSVEGGYNNIHSTTKKQPDPEDVTLTAIAATPIWKTPHSIHGDVQYYVIQPRVVPSSVSFGTIA